MDPRTADVDDEANLLRERKTGHAIDNFVEAFAVEKLHGDEGRVALVAELKDGDNIGVAEIACRASFGIEAFEMLRIFGKAGGQSFERDDAVDERVAGLVNDTHGALAHFGNNFEFAEFLHCLLG